MRLKEHKRGFDSRGLHGLARNEHGIALRTRQHGTGAARIAAPADDG
jgi:hypothetical protein